MRIPVEQIDPSSLQLREDFNELEVEGDLLASIDRVGVKEPLRVYLKEDGRAELIDGHRRLSAVLKLLNRYARAPDAEVQSKAARFRELVCLVEDIPPSEQKHLELQFLLNAVRKTFSPVEQARYLFRIKALKPEMTQKELGKKLPDPKSQGYVSRLLILAQDEALLQRVKNRELTSMEAYQLVVKRQKKTKPPKGKQETAPAASEVKGRKNSSAARGRKERAGDARKTDAVLFEWQEKETSVNVIVTGPAKQQQNILFVLSSLVRQLELEAKHKPGND
jgi:ParB-like chromosome segregation protein Spo0J